MSYTRTMTGSVTWYTSGSVSYPASENGGSVSYSDSGEVPVTINVTVDTTPYDLSIKTCNTELGLLTSSVIATNSAQCKAIDTAAKDVSNHITKGFFTLIGSEISQLAAQLFSKMQSLIGFILERTKTINKQQKLMEQDYSRILSRYKKVFNDLDDECKKRVIELDKAAYTLATKTLENQILKPQTRDLAHFITYFNDTSLLNTKLLLSHTKSRVKDVENDMAKNIFQEVTYKNQLKKILHNKSANSMYEVFAPVIYAKVVATESADNTYTENYYMAQDLQNFFDPITKNIEDFAVGYNTWGVQSDLEKNSVRSIFNSFAEEYLGNENDEYKNRVYKMMMELLDKNNIKTFAQV